MNRLQKKCLITTAGFHLLVVTLVCCSGFFTFTRKPKPDDTQPVTVIPANLIDAELSSGVKGAQPPPPTAPTPPQPVQQPTPPQPKPPEPKPEPVKQPDPVPVKPQKLTPDDLKPVDPTPKPVKPVPEKPKINLTMVTRSVPKVTDTREADAQREAAKEAKRRATAIARALKDINSHVSTDTKIDMPGNGVVSYANYDSVVKSIYTQAWTPPDDTASDDANTKVAVTIASDGTVISAHILNPSGDARVDASVQRTLDRVKFVAPFPDGAKEKERTFKINFNLKAKRMLG